MLGIPIGVWILLALVVVVFLVARSFYGRFRGMCRRVREELSAYLPKVRPELDVVGERQGNLVVRTQDGQEELWEMADVYAAVARLPGMGADPQARAAIYQRAVEARFQPAIDPAAPLDRATHGSLIRPQLVRPDAPSVPPDAVRTPLPELGLEVVYLLPGDRAVTEGDLANLGLDLAGVHQLALENLRRDFPAEMVGTARTSDNGSAIQLGDSFDAARLLLVPELLAEGEEVVALVPHRDLLILLPASMLQEPDRLREGLALLDIHGHPPLLDQAIRVRHNGFELA